MENEIKKHRLCECCNEDCNKKDSCKRYTVIKEECCIKFSNICSEDNNYKWYVKKDKEEMITYGN